MKKYISKIKQLPRTLVRRCYKRFTPQCLILMYHRIAETDSDLDPWALCVTPKYFQEHLEVLQKYTQPISLQQLATNHQQGIISHKTVAITFDDGYANNFYNAKPLLERYNIPATVFVTTENIGQEREYWWDELEQMLLRPGKLPGTLTLSISGKIHQWELGTAANYTPEQRERDRHIKAWEASANTRLRFYYSVWEKLQKLPADKQRLAMDTIIQWTGKEATLRPDYRALVLEELHQLGEGGLVEIGAHTLNHACLSAHPANFQLQEIQQSKDYLEKVLQRSVTSFAYPYGDYNQETVSLMEKIGVERACSTITASVSRRSSRFELPRFDMENWNGTEFERVLMKWLYG